MILFEETKYKFGYEVPKGIKNFHRPVVVKCDSCEKVRDVSSAKPRHFGYPSYCKYCAANQRWKPNNFIPLHKHEEEVVDLYENKELSANKIAKRFNVDIHSVCRLLKKHGVKLKPNGYHKLTRFDEDKAIDLYVNKKLTAGEVMRMLSIPSTFIIYKMLRRHNIPVRKTHFYYNDPKRKDKWVKNILVALKNRGFITASCQQKYINNLYGGELNKLVGGRYYADITIESSIICEYDGGGHYGAHKTKTGIEKKRKKDLVRARRLITEFGYKVFRIIALKDRIPSDNILLDMALYAQLCFSSGVPLVYFDIDAGTVECGSCVLPYRYGELRKINPIIAAATEPVIGC